MKDLIAKLLAALPAYARQLRDLLLRPKDFIVKADLESDDAIQQALTFAAISYGLVFIGQIPLLPEKQHMEVAFGVRAICVAVAFILNVLIVGWSWRAVGGTLPWKKLIVPTSYFSGVVMLQAMVVALVAAGVFNALDPVLFRQTMNGAVIEPVDLMNSAAFWVFQGIAGVGLLLICGWVLSVWGAYRELNQVSKRRSGMAFALYSVLSLPAAGVVLLMLYSATPQTSTPAPPELVGRWDIKSQTDSGKEHTRETQTFNVGRDGGYYLLDSKAWTNGQCVKLNSAWSVGHLIVEGSKLTLTQSSKTSSVDDRCTGDKSQNKLEPVKEVYQYEIRQSPAGQQLCLAGRFGQSCFSPEPR